MKLLSNGPLRLNTLCSLAWTTSLFVSPVSADEPKPVSASGNIVSKAKSTMSEFGIEPHVSYFNTWMGNLTGGQGTGGAYKGNLTFGVRSDLERVVGWHGGQLFVSGVNTHGDSLSGKFVGDTLGTRKDDEAASTHLFEFGLEQKFLSDRLSVKAGQLAATSDFFSSISGLFIHDSFNWGPNGQSSAPGGPDSSLGARLRFDLSPRVYVMAGVYDNATSGDFGSLKDDKHGTRWALPYGDRAVWISEAGAVFSKALFRQPAVVKAGMWVNESNQTDFEGDGQSRNWGGYAVAEQTVWTATTDPSQTITVFSRLAYADPGQNQFEWQINAGLVAKGLVPGRDSDSTGLAFTYAATSSGWRANNNAGHGETAFEVHHQFVLAPWCRLSLFAQYLPDPGKANGNTANGAFVTGLGGLFNF